MPVVIVGCASGVSDSILVVFRIDGKPSIWLQYIHGFDLSHYPFHMSLSLSLSWLPSISRFILNVNRKGHIFPSLRRPAAWLIATDVHIIIVMHVSEVWADHWNRCTVTSYVPIEIKTQKLYKSKEKKKQCPHRRHRRRWIASKPDPTDRRGQTERCNLVTEM